jgi:hypothetical protein
MDTEKNESSASLDWSKLTPRICPAGECLCGGWCFGADRAAADRRPEFYGFISFDHQHKIEQLQLAKGRLAFAVTQRNNALALLGMGVEKTLEQASRGERTSPADQRLNDDWRLDAARWGNEISKREGEVKKARDSYRLFAALHRISLLVFWRAKEMGELDEYYAKQARARRERMEWEAANPAAAARQRARREARMLQRSQGRDSSKDDHQALADVFPGS